MIIINLQATEGFSIGDDTWSVFVGTVAPLPKSDSTPSGNLLFMICNLSFRINRINFSILIYFAGSVTKEEGSGKL